MAWCDMLQCHTSNPCQHCARHRQWMCIRCTVVAATIWRGSGWCCCRVSQSPDRSRKLFVGATSCANGHAQGVLQYMCADAAWRLLRPDRRQSCAAAWRLCDLGGSSHRRSAVHQGDPTVGDGGARVHPLQRPAAAGRGGGARSLDEVDVLLAAAQTVRVTQATGAHRLCCPQSQAPGQGHQALWVAAAACTGVCVAGLRQCTGVLLARLVSLVTVRQAVQAAVCCPEPACCVAAVAMPDGACVPYLANLA